MRPIVPHRLPSGKYRIQIKREGWPRIDKADLPSLEAAEAEIERLTALYGGRTVDKLTVAEAWALYLESDTFLDKAENTRKCEKRVAPHFLKSIGHYKLIFIQQNPQVLVQYRQERSKATYKPGINTPERKYGKNQLRLEFAGISALFNYAREQGWCQQNPVLGIKRPHKKAEVRRVPKQEYGAILLAAINMDFSDADRERCRFFAIQQDIGCRPGELAKAKKSDLNLADKVITFPDTKNGEPRVVPLDSNQVEWFAKQLVYAAVKEGDKESPFIFSTMSKEGEWVQFGYSAAFNRLRKLGIANPAGTTRPHDRRHEFVSSAVESGQPVDEIKLITGHKSSQAFDRYNHAKATATQARARIEARKEDKAYEKLVAMGEALGTGPEALASLIKSQAELHRRLAESGLSLPDEPHLTNK